MFNNHNLEKLVNELISEFENSKELGIVFSIQSQEELKDKKIIDSFKQDFETIKFKIKEMKNLNCLIDIYLILQINIETQQFRDIEITTIRNIKQQCDLLMIYSYSNNMLEQIISKKVAHMIVNVFSQKLVNRYDFIHHFNSGINHVLCSEMSQNSMLLGVDISEFNTVSSLKQSKYFSSCIQNSKLATKAKVPQMVFKLINSKEDIRSSREIESIQKALFKAQPFQILQQKQCIEEFLKKQRKIKQGEYIE